jgi:hypothetical protein
MKVLERKSLQQYLYYFCLKQARKNQKHTKMLDSIIEKLKSEVGGQILRQTNLPSGKLDGVFSIIGDVTKKEVAGQMLGGGLSTVMNLFSNQTNNQSADNLQSRITSGVMGNLVNKLGLSQGLANSIVAMAVPAIIGLITKKNSETPDDDSSPLEAIFGGSGSGLGGDLGGILGKLF